MNAEDANKQEANANKQEANANEKNVDNITAKEIKGCITLSPTILVFWIATTIFFLISLPIAIWPRSAEWEEEKYTGRAWVGGSVAGTLRTANYAEAQLQSACIIDDDHDGVGEYGLLSELAGGSFRNGRSPLEPAYITNVLSMPNSKGFVSKSGFNYRSYVPDDRGDKKFSGDDGPTLEDVFFGEPWVTPINDWNWKMCDSY